MGMGSRFWVWAEGLEIGGCEGQVSLTEAGLRLAGELRNLAEAYDPGQLLHICMFAIETEEENKEAFNSWFEFEFPCFNALAVSTVKLVVPGEIVGLRSRLDMTCGFQAILALIPLDSNLLVEVAVSWRLFESQTIQDESNQRENIFHARCLIQGKVCLLNIDSGSCANMVSSRVVSKLNLVTRPHPTPYQLQWISEVGDIIVNKQVEIPFSIGKYEDIVPCDVVHMETSNMILGRPWQFDKRTIHDCFSNKITFLHQNRKVEPLVHSDVCLDVHELPKEASKTLPPMEPDDNEKNVEKELWRCLDQPKAQQAWNSVRPSKSDFVWMTRHEQGLKAIEGYPYNML
ncbi:hypothetical protein Lal_00049285 [Lupinus albus]|nr:hypothetical protein Lal_00049285 [Lupinus albus]